MVETTDAHDVVLLFQTMMVTTKMYPIVLWEPNYIFELEYYAVNSRYATVVFEIVVAIRNFEYSIMYYTSSGCCDHKLLTCRSFFVYLLYWADSTRSSAC